MGGSIRCCPNCGEYVLPPAVQVVRIDGPPYEKAECVSCGWYGFTEDLRLKFIPTMLVGQPTPPIPQNTFFEIDGSAAVFGQSFNTLTTEPAFTPGSDELVVACVSFHKLANLVGVSCGGSPMSLASQLVNTGNDPDLDGSMWYLHGPSQVSSQITAEWDDVISDASISVLRFQGYRTFVQASQDDDGGAFFSSGNTGTLPVSESVAVGMTAVSLNPETLAGPPTPGEGFSLDAVVGDGTEVDLSAGVFNGHKFLSTNDSVRWAGGILANGGYSSIVAVFKP